MATPTIIKNEYFDWLMNIVCGDRFADSISYKKLLMHLHRIDFRYSIRMDENRAEEGVTLRYRFTVDNGYSDHVADYIDGPCSVLEMIAALAIRCEENFMDDPNIGDRTGQWFWGMINSLGLSGMEDSVYDRDIVEGAIQHFLDRDYAPNGKGGLFTIRNCKEDLRKVEIWYQLCWYIDSIVGL